VGAALYFETMNSITLRLVIVLAALSISGLIIMQVLLLQKAFRQEEKSFSHNVLLSLKSVATQLIRLDQPGAVVADPVEQLADNYYVVMVNDAVDAGLLESLLQKEFTQRNIAVNFEYGIYNCQTNRMVFGNSVSTNTALQSSLPQGLPTYDQDNYYFGVYFPSKRANLAAQMHFWVFSSGFVLLLVLFFAFAIYYILRQRRLSQLQKQFVNNMTHEFKTPIATIALSAQALAGYEQAPKPGRVTKYAGIIGQEAGRLQQHIEQVLQVALLDNQRLPLKKEQVQVHQLLQQVVSQCQEQHPKLTVQWQLQAAQHTLHADPLHLAGVFANLLDNAAKYAGPEATVHIKTFNHKKQWGISLCDDGPGIENAHLKKVFSRFYRVPTGNLHNVKGFGLGLHFVKQLVQAHGGHISISSTPGKGSCIKILLPYA